MERIRKEVHLTFPIVKSLKKIAAASGKSPKNYIEDLVIESTRTQMVEIKKLNNELYRSVPR